MDRTWEDASGHPCAAQLHAPSRVSSQGRLRQELKDRLRPARLHREALSGKQQQWLGPCADRRDQQG